MAMNDRSKHLAWGIDDVEFHPPAPNTADKMIAATTKAGTPASQEKPIHHKDQKSVELETRLPDTPQDVPPNDDEHREH
jgi:hypothetical protein